MDAAENERIPPNKQSACHPERSRTFSERIARKKQGAKAPQGSRNEFWWLTAMNVTFTVESHRDFKRDPASPKGSRFRSFAEAQPAEVRLALAAFSEMTYSGVVLRYVLEKSLCPPKNTRRGDSRIDRKRTHTANKDGRTQFAPTTHLRFTVGRCLGAAAKHQKQKQPKIPIDTPWRP